MKKILTLLLSVLGLSAQAAPAQQSPDVFTAEFVTALRAASPRLAIAVKGALRLVVKGSNGNEMSVFLGNAYNEFVIDPNDKRAVIERFVASVVESATPHAGVDASLIVPVIKDRRWLQDIRAAEEKVFAGRKGERVVEDFNDELVIVYAEDSPRNIRFLTPKDLETSGLEKGKLRAIAIANLRRLLPQVETHRGPLVSMLTAGGDYVSSLVLLDDLWARKKADVDGDIVIAVPSRDLLLMTGSKNGAGVAQLRALARKAAAESTYSLTSSLFVYRNGKFEVFAQ